MESLIKRLWLISSIFLIVLIWTKLSKIAFREYDFDRIKDNAYFSTQNKNTIIYEAKVVPLRSKEGEIIGHILLSNDVTAIKEAEFRTDESKKNLEMAMEAASMSSWVYDVYKKTFNPLHGDPVAKNNTTLDQILNILHPQDHEPLIQLLSQLTNKEIQQGNITLRFIMKKKSNTAIMKA